MVSYTTTTILPAFFCQIISANCFNILMKEHWILNKKNAKNSGSSKLTLSCKIDVLFIVDLVIWLSDWRLWTNSSCLA